MWIVSACVKEEATAVKQSDNDANESEKDAAPGGPDDTNLNGNQGVDGGTTDTTLDDQNAGTDTIGNSGANAQGGTGGIGGGVDDASVDGSGPTQDATLADDAAERPPIPDFTLVVDTPSSGDTLEGEVTVSGRAPGFLNVEVWDAEHMKPPLAQATPDDSGSFVMTIDVSSLDAGTTMWTIYAWDSPPGEPFNQTKNVILNLTIVRDSCSEQTCSGHGTCVVEGGIATCDCEQDYHAVGLSCVSDQSSDEGQPDPASTYVPEGYTLTFSDEFEGDTLDTNKWNHLAPYGVQWYSDSGQKQAFIADAIRLDNGIVTFTAQPSSRSDTNGQPYSSGGLTTNGTFTHGYFEARVKVPAGKGLWPAFWTTSSERWPPEWDIFEIIDGEIFGFTHPVQGGSCTFAEGAAGADATYTIDDLYGIYHIYGFLWTETDLYWYVDGVMTEHYQCNAAAGTNDPFWLAISLQVGGEWPGDPDSTTPFPAHMEVDYVRVYQQ